MQMVERKIRSKCVICRFQAITRISWRSCGVMGNLRGAQEVTWRDVTLLVGRGQVFEFARARDRASERRVGVRYRESERHNDNERSTEDGVHARTDLVDYFCLSRGNDERSFLSIPLWMIMVTVNFKQNLFLIDNIKITREFWGTRLIVLDSISSIDYTRYV